MTAAIGPGTQLRYVGYRGVPGAFNLVLGRIYTVDRIWHCDDTACIVCGGRIGVSLVGEWRGGRRPNTIMTWCPCGFRPVGGDDAVLQQFSTEPTKVKELT